MQQLGSWKSRNLLHWRQFSILPATIINFTLPLFLVRLGGMSESKLMRRRRKSEISDIWYFHFSHACSGSAAVRPGPKAHSEHTHNSVNKILEWKNRKLLPVSGRWLREKWLDKQFAVEWAVWAESKEGHSSSACPTPIPHVAHIPFSYLRDEIYMEKHCVLRRTNAKLHPNSASSCRQRAFCSAMRKIYIREERSAG